jgi:hypothetical protein
LENMQQTGLIVEMEFHIQQKFQHSTLPWKCCLNRRSLRFLQR